MNQYGRTQASLLFAGFAGKFVAGIGVMPLD
jgi:hypothetical protein